jgi:beta-galactosidase
VLDEDKDFAWASGRFQLECYKEEIEANLRTPGLAGFQLLDLHDYLGQGTALIGVVDAFWEPKSYVTAEEFRSFAGPTVPLARLAIAFSPAIKLSNRMWKFITSAKCQSPMPRRNGRL